MSGPAFEFGGATALVTGAAGGIGLAIARRFAEAGARVVLCDRDPARLEAAAASIPGETHRVACDISSESEVEAAFAEVAAMTGSIEVLVNNAGISEPIVRTVDQQLGDWQRVVDVNLRGTFLASREMGRHVLRRKARGAIVNIASVAGLEGHAGSNAYGVSKAGVVQLTRTMACEWAGRGLRVNSVAPGFIEAPMARDIFATGRVDRQRIEGRTPMQRLGLPEEIANAVVFLASDLAAFITGVTLPVDGGWTANGGP